MAGASLSPGLIESVQISCSPHPATKTLPLMLSTNCPEVSRPEPQATQQTLSRPYANPKFRLPCASLSFIHPHPPMNLSTCCLRHVAWVLPQGSRIWYPHGTKMNLWGRMCPPSAPGGLTRFTQPKLQTPEKGDPESSPTRDRQAAGRC